MIEVTSEMELLGQRRNFQIVLSRWYATARRPLPWRAEPSLYRTVVSELMAQQTRIKTMLPYFERWMQRFPDFRALAQADEVDVLKHWEGLGYYSRARNLHKLAQAYNAANPKPATREQWQSLPGIGPYTSAAIASIAFDEPVAVVDGNVVRILARLTHDTRTFSSNGEAVKAFTKLAAKLVPDQNPGDHNQAMMELGATVCLKPKPLCTLCPVRVFCRSFASKKVETIPQIQRKATEHLEVPRAWVVHNNAILLHRIPAHSDQLAGQHELPKLEALSDAAPSPKLLARKTRSITNHRIKESIFEVAITEKLPSSIESNPEFHWVPLDQIRTITLSGPHRRWIEELFATNHAKA